MSLRGHKLILFLKQITNKILCSLRCPGWCQQLKSFISVYLWKWRVPLPYLFTIRQYVTYAIHNVFQWFPVYYIYLFSGLCLVGVKSENEAQNEKEQENYLQETNKWKDNFHVKEIIPAAALMVFNSLWQRCDLPLQDNTKQKITDNARSVH